MDDLNKSPYDKLVLFVSGHFKDFRFKNKNPEIAEHDTEFLDSVITTVLSCYSNPKDLRGLEANPDVNECLDHLMADAFYRSKYDQSMTGYILREKRKAPVFKGVRYWKSRLKDLLFNRLRSTDKENLINSVIHLLIFSMEKFIEPTSPRWESWINARKSRIPTYEQLVFNGIVPNVQLKKYDNLFYQSEKDKMLSDGLYAIETKIREERRKAVSLQDLDRLTRWGSSTKETIKQSSLSLAMDVKTKRLNAATATKGDRQFKTIMKMYSQDSGRGEYFTPFMITTDGLNYSVSEMRSRVKAVDDKGHYAFDSTNMTDNVLIACGQEYARLVS
jgi:hypothetical protein